MAFGCLEKNWIHVCFFFYTPEGTTILPLKYGWNGRRFDRFAQLWGRTEICVGRDGVLLLMVQKSQGQPPGM